MKLKISVKESEKPILLTENLAYLIGFIIGDGNLKKSDYCVRAVEENKEFIENVYAKIFSEIFGVKPKIYFDKYNGSYVAYKHSKAIYNQLVELGIPAGTKSRAVRVPERVMKSQSKEIQSCFLSGLFDAEGSIINMRDSHHKNGYPRTQLKVCSHGLVIDIYNLLQNLGMSPKIYRYGWFSVLNLNGKKQCKAFQDNVNFKHPLKNKKLRMLLRQKSRGREFASVARLTKVAVAKAKTAQLRQGGWV